MHVVNGTPGVSDPRKPLGLPWVPPTPPPKPPRDRASGSALHTALAVAEDKACSSAEGPRCENRWVAVGFLSEPKAYRVAQVLVLVPFTKVPFGFMFSVTATPLEPRMDWGTGWLLTRSLVESVTERRESSGIQESRLEKN